MLYLNDCSIMLIFAFRTLTNVYKWNNKYCCEYFLSFDFSNVNATYLHMTEFKSQSIKFEGLLG